jgi:hypothetical protein
MRLERMRQASQTQARRKDTREKIQLGGLITKAGLRHEKRALLLGLLIDAAERIRDDEAERARLLALGERAFLNEHD